MRKLLVVLVVVAGLLVAGDRVAAWAAERVLAEQAARELAANNVHADPPEADIAGFPFLTQVVSGDYQEVTLRLRDVGTSDLRVPVLDLTATGVDAPVSTLLSGSGPIHAERVRGTAVVGYDQVRALTGYDELALTAHQGRLSIHLPAELVGEAFTVEGTADVEVSDHFIQVRVIELAVTSDVVPPGAEALVNQLAQELSVQVMLPPLPYGLTVESVRAEPQGLVATVSAANVPLAR